MDGEKKKPKFSIGYLIIAFWAVLLLQQALSGIPAAAPDVVQRLQGRGRQATRSRRSRSVRR